MFLPPPLLPLRCGVRRRAHVRPRNSPRLEPILRAVPLKQLVLPLDRLDRLELPADQLRVIGPAEADIRLVVCLSALMLRMCRQEYNNACAKPIPNLVVRMLSLLLHVTALMN